MLNYKKKIINSIFKYFFCRMEASLPRRAFAEAIGVFILCTIGNGSVAELVVAGRKCFQKIIIVVDFNFS